MFGVDLDHPVLYQGASLRYFKPGEYHVSRFCRFNVLLLVFAGTLRFREDGIEQEIGPGEYYIQRQDTAQDAPRPSDAPQYLYVHFQADWADGPSALPRRGVFDYSALRNTMEMLDRLEHSGAPYVLKAHSFFALLCALHAPEPPNSMTDQLTRYVEENLHRQISLDMLCEAFHFSKNHIIHLFRKAFGMTPVAYINQMRLRKAEYRMTAFSDPLEQIALQCGFQNYSHFYKLFCRANGMAPEQWRKQKRLG